MHNLVECGYEMTYYYMVKRCPSNSLIGLPKIFRFKEINIRLVLAACSVDLYIISVNTSRLSSVLLLHGPGQMLVPLKVAKVIHHF